MAESGGQRGYLDRLADQVQAVMMAASDRLAAVGTPNAIEQGIGVAKAIPPVVHAIRTAVPPPTPSQLVTVGHNLGVDEVVVRIDGPGVQFAEPSRAVPHQFVAVVPDDAGPGPVYVRHGLGTRLVEIAIVDADRDPIPPWSSMSVDADTVMISAPVDLSGCTVVITRQ